MYRCEIVARPCQANMEHAHMEESPQAAPRGRTEIEHPQAHQMRRFVALAIAGILAGSSLAIAGPASDKYGCGTEANAPTIQQTSSAV